FIVLIKHIPGIDPHLTGPVRRGIKWNQDFQLLLIPKKLHALIRDQLRADREYRPGGGIFQDDTGNLVGAKCLIKLQGGYHPDGLFAQYKPGSEHGIAANIPYPASAMLRLVSDVIRISIVVAEKALHNTGFA